MNPQRWAIIEALYHAALEKQPGERSSYLVAACAEDPTLQNEVESLLGYADPNLPEPAERSEVAKILGEIVGIPAIDRMEVSRAVDGTTLAPIRVGMYRIVRVLGEGGMGTVYEAEQEHPRRAVALKVIRPGLARFELIRRFEQESQALARLQHPGIAQIYEAGTADSGSGPQPYFAMEFIRGDSLLEYAKRHQLNTRQSLELVAKICDAVHHAHQRGIIHRDLKPGNILVDESGQPKILDFGVARVTDIDAKNTRQTDVGQIVGTLAYMSPEQVLADPLELDTRSDVYTLGVLLFELLTGRLPYKVSGQIHEALHTIREEDPAPLSAISRSYRGDIETIVGKALVKDKARRYASAAGMAADIRRYLSDEPIAARPPSAVYQLQKFAHRHKAVVAGVAAVFVVLITGIVASTWEATRARRAEQVATTEAATAKAVNDFLQKDLLAQASANSQAGPETKPDPDLKVRTALDAAAARITGKFATQPLVEASIRQTMGNTYRELGQYPQAEQQLERAFDLKRRVLGKEDRDLLDTMNDLAALYYAEGKYAQAEPLYTRALEEQRRVLGREHSSTLETMGNLAVLYWNEGKYAQSEPLFTEALEVQRRVLGEQHPSTLETMGNLALLYYSEGKYAQSEPLSIRVLDLRRRVLGEEHPNTLLSMNNLALLYYAQRKYAQAETVFTKALEVQRRILGEEHPDTLTSMNNLALLYYTEGKNGQAEPLYAKVLEVQRRMLGEEHPSTLLSMNNLATLYVSEDKYTQAEALYAEALQVQRRHLGEEHPDTLNTMNNLAVLYRKEGKNVQAESLFTRVLDARRRLLGEDHPDTLMSMNNLADQYLYEGKYAQAEPLFTKVLDLQRRVLGPEHPRRVASMNDLALVYLNEAKYSQAEALLREALESLDRTTPGDWRRYNTESMLGVSLSGQKKFPEAEELLLSGYAGMVERKASIPADRQFKVGQAGDRIVQLYRDWSKPEKEAEWRKKLHLIAPAPGAY